MVQLSDFHARATDWDRAFGSTRPTITSLLPGLILGSTGVLVGPSGVSKSFMALQTAMSVGLGQDLWHLWSAGEKLPQGKAVLINLEDPQDVLDQRLFDIRQSLPLTSKQQDAVRAYVSVHSMADTGFILAQRRSDKSIVASTWLDKLTELAADARLVIIDTFNLALGAALDENNGLEMGGVVALLNTMSRKIGCATLILHHTNKSALDRRSGQSAMDGARGSNAIVSNTRWVTFMLPMEDPHAKSLGLSPEQQSHWVKVIAPKFNYGAGTPERWLFRSPDTGVLSGRAEAPTRTSRKAAAAPPKATSPATIRKPKKLLNLAVAND